MPSMANITVKNKANVDVVYVAATPSAGDRSPAKWVQNAAQAILGWRPFFTMLTRDNGNKTARHFNTQLRFPIVDPNGGGVGIPRVVAVVPINTEGTLPTNVDNALVEEAFVQNGNLLVSSLIRAAAAEGYAPT